MDASSNRVCADCGATIPPEGGDVECLAEACGERCTLTADKSVPDAIPNSAATDECGFIYSPERPPCRLPKGHDGMHVGRSTRNRVRAWSADYLAGWRAAMTEARGGDWSQEFPDA